MKSSFRHVQKSGAAKAAHAAPRNALPSRPGKQSTPAAGRDAAKAGRQQGSAATGLGAARGAAPTEVQAPLPVSQVEEAEWVPGGFQVKPALIWAPSQRGTVVSVFEPR